ncbi:MAG: hypothetical protein PHN18_10300 [Sulfurospirillaceae bacterium]|nr:hypothetical protein [Sulfurospirillaceae bacterium]MDD2827470.1 hypothetical protein [Sulfurospirillaceae bacterium]
MFIRSLILFSVIALHVHAENNVTENIFLAEKPDGSSFVLNTKEGYFAKLKDIDVVKGEIKYKIFTKGSEEESGYYNYINNILKNSVAISQNAINEQIASFPKNETLSKTEEIKEIQKAENALDLSQFLISVFLLDSDKINIEETLLNNKIILVNPYTRAFKADTLDERALIFYIKLFVKADEFLLDINSFVFFLFMPYIVLAYLAKRFLKAFKDDAEESTLERALVGCFILYLFYFAHTSNQVSRTHFQTAYSVFIQETLELSTKLTSIFSSTFTSYQARNSGLLDKQELEKVITNSLQNEKVLPKYKAYFEQCLDIYNTDIHFPRNDEGFIFPKNLTTNHLGSTWSERSTQKDTSVIQITSLEFCHNVEAKIKYLTLKQVENTKILQDYQAASADRLNEQQLVLLQKMQMQNVHDLGFLAAPIIASNNMFSENLNMFQRTQRSANDIETAIAQKDKNQDMQKGVIADSVLGDIIELLPYMLVPGSDSIKKTVTDTLGTVSSKLEALPLVGKFVSTAKQGVGIGVAIFLIKYVIIYLPFVALILASFLVTVYYLISVIIYLNLAPFLAAFAFARGQTEQLKAFFTKGVLIGLKPLILVISIIMGVIGLDLVKAFNLLIIEEQFNNFFAITMTQETLSTAYAFSDYGLLFLKGFIALIISITAAIIVFYVVLNGADVITRILGIDEKTSGDTQNVVGNQIEQKTSRFSKM